MQEDYYQYNGQDCIPVGTVCHEETLGAPGAAYIKMCDAGPHMHADRASSAASEDGPAPDALLQATTPRSQTCRRVSRGCCCKKMLSVIFPHALAPDLPCLSSYTASP